MFRLLARTILKRSLRAHLRGDADALLRTYWKMRFTQSLRLLICICWVALGFAQGDSERAIRNRELALQDGTRIHFLEAGRPGLPALVLIPGWALPASLWAHQIETFSTNRLVIAIDPRSQGDSSKTDIGNTPEQRARDLHEVLTALHIPSAVLVGWSQGSQDVAAYVQQFGTSSVAGLAFVDSPVSAGPSEIEEDREWSKQLLGRLAIYANHPAEYCKGMVQSIFKKPHPGLDIDSIVAHCRKTPVSTGLTMLVMDIFGVDRRAALTKIDKPTLVIASAESPLLASQKKMATAIPNAYFESIPGAGHALFLDEPGMFDSALRRLLDQSSKPQSDSKRPSSGGARYEHRPAAHEVRHAASQGLKPMSAVATQ
jgi:microsomal epoxide hydrolase